jgi:hypothetical protein
VSAMVTGIMLLIGTLLVDSPLQTAVQYLAFLVGAPFTTM